MAVSQQVLHSMSVKLLKNLKDFEISFDGHPVTAILGPNGNGKSTILHALACSFSKNEIGEDYKFSRFFLPNTDSLWNGSRLSITHSYRESSAVHERIPREYEKTLARWTPRYANRPKRDVFYIGIDKCVPMIESEKKQAKINYSTRGVDGVVIETILDKASAILNRRYSTYNIHKASGKEFIGVVANDLQYSALSMSAGEQKVFYILDKVFRANKYSLILIDELDLLLHDKAMKNLLDVILERSLDKSLQVVFTTHRESVLDLEGRINIRHIVCRQEKTLCFDETKPDAINRLTGVNQFPIEVFVEDDLACAIVSKVAAKLKIAKYTSIKRYGSAINCFTVVGGLLLGGDSCNNSLFVLDGDLYRTQQAKVEAVNKVVTGHDQNAVQSREKAISIIKQFLLPEGVSPERYLHSLLVKMQETDNDEFNEIIGLAKEIEAVDNDHKYIGNIIDRLGYEKNVGFSKIIDLVSTADEWDSYVGEIFSWLDAKKEAVVY